MTQRPRIRSAPGARPAGGNASGCVCRATYAPVRVRSAPGSPDPWSLTCDPVASSGAIRGEVIRILGGAVGGSAGVLVCCLLCAGAYIRNRERDRWRAELEARKQVISELVARLSRADCEEDILSETIKALRRLFPGGSGYAVGTLEDVGSQGSPDRKSVV